MERAITFIETKELPPHWDRDILFSNADQESTNNSTTASSESEVDDDDEEDEDESPEAKDHLVAELYKHMEDRGSPIDKTPTIDGKVVNIPQCGNFMIFLSLRFYSPCNMKLKK